MNQSERLRADLEHFRGGTETWWRHPLNRNVTYTDGVKYFADNAAGGAHWLLDIIATELAPFARTHGIAFLTAASDGRRATLSLRRDSDEPPLWTRDIALTDLPEGDWPLWIADGGPGGTAVVMLPSEY